MASRRAHAPDRRPGRSGSMTSVITAVEHPPAGEGSPQQLSPAAESVDGAPAESVAGGAHNRRLSRMSLSLAVMAAIALVAALGLARAFVVPLLTGILASY